MAQSRSAARAPAPQLRQQRTSRGYWSEWRMAALLLTALAAIFVMLFVLLGGVNNVAAIMGALSLEGAQPPREKPTAAANDPAAAKGELDAALKAYNRNLDAARRLRPEASQDDDEGGEIFRPWRWYEIADEKELDARIVAGRKDSIAYSIRILPRRGQLPTEEQLADISERMRSDDYRSTFIYFYVKGMDTRQGPWATAHHTPDEALGVKYYGEKEW